MQPRDWALIISYSESFQVGGKSKSFPYCFLYNWERNGTKNSWKSYLGSKIVYFDLCTQNLAPPRPSSLWICNLRARVREIFFASSALEKRISEHIIAWQALKLRSTVSRSLKFPFYLFFLQVLSLLRGKSKLSYLGLKARPRQLGERSPQLSNPPPPPSVKWTENHPIYLNIQSLYSLNYL